MKNILPLSVAIATVQYVGRTPVAPTGVASNYKSVIKSGAKRAKKKSPRATAAKEHSPPVTAAAVPASKGTQRLEPNVVELLKAGKSLGWKQVRSIVDLMLDK